MKTKEELNALRNEVEALNAKLAELTEDELKLVTGGEMPPIKDDEKYVMTVFDRVEDDPDAREAMTPGGPGLRPRH